MPTLIFPGKYESLPAISDFVTKFAREVGFNEDAVYAVELAVDEACTNIIEHAYKHEEGDIVCACVEISNGIKITLLDQGETFDPRYVPEPDPALPLEKVSPRGAGLFLMRKMMDEVHFEFDPDKGNVLTMVKLLS
jgi:serine/threonine-protein kinase RsbW